MHQEIQNLVTKVSDNQEIHFTIKMPDYELSYSIPRLEENFCIKQEVLVPQLLLNNPITDPGHSEHVHKYMQVRNSERAKFCSSEEASAESQEENLNEFNCKKPLNLSVRKDLLIPSHVQKLREFRVNKKQKLDMPSLFEDTSSTMAKLITEASQDLETSRKLIREKNMKENFICEGIASFLTERRSNEHEEYSSSVPLKRKLVIDEDRPVEPQRKALKSSRSIVNETVPDDAPLIKKIHKDCQWALKQDLHGNYPLHNAVLNSNLKLVKRFSLVLTALNKSLNLKNLHGMSPLLLAVDRQQPTIVSELLRMGADPLVSTFDGNTSYHLAIVRRNEKTLRELLKRSLNRESVEMLNDKGLAPLHLAVLVRNEKLVKMLLAFGATPDCQDARNGKTPIFLATELGCPRLVQLLLAYGASVTLANYGGVAPVSISSETRAAFDALNPSQLSLGSDSMKKCRSRIK